MTYRDWLAQYPAGVEEKYRLMLANAPFAGSLDYESCDRFCSPSLLLTPAPELSKWLQEVSIAFQSHSNELATSADFGLRK